MPEFILHRANNLKQAKLAEGFSGAEIDLRLYFGKLVLAHDPFMEGVSFTEWLSSFTGNFIILNTKETGLEEEIVRIISGVAPQIEYLFLDLPMPSMIKAAKKKIPVAVRVSEEEPIAFASRIFSNWIWLDSFSGNWTHLEEIRMLRSSIPQKICLVSPELQDRWPYANSEEFDWLKGYLRENPGQIQAICTKDRKFWND